MKQNGNMHGSNFTNALKIERNFWATFTVSKELQKRIMKIRNPELS